MYCQEMKSSYLHVVPQYLLPMVVKFLTDMNNQVIGLDLLFNYQVIHILFII